MSTKLPDEVVKVTFVAPRELVGKVARIGERDERTLSAVCRIALRQYVEKEGSAAA